MRRILLAVLGFLLLVGLAISVDLTPLESTSKNKLFNYEDNTTGVGNFASYDKVVEQGPHADARILSRLADVSIQRMDHGSGLIKREMIISSDSTINRNVSPDYYYDYSLINALVSSNMVYGPQVVSIGKGYYASHPVMFNSLLGDKTEIKNHASETSIDQETTHSRAISEELAASVEDDHYDAEWLSFEGLARSLMNLNENVTSGTAHIGMLQGRRAFDSGKSALYQPNTDIDEVYTGTFGIVTNMNLTLPISKAGHSESWLPCSCTTGWNDMNLHDQRYHSAKGFFDCTSCPNLPAQAQCTKEG